MKVYRTTDALPHGAIQTAVTFGNFDGVHLGHRRVLSQLIDSAKQVGVTSALVTFEPHPLTVLAPDRVPRSLLTLDDRLSYISELGVDMVVVLAFNTELARCPAEQFVRDILVARLGARVVLVGPDARFGADRHGDATLLAEMGAMYGFSTQTIAFEELFGEKVSSSRIRRLLLAGEVEHAARLLGRPHHIVGTIVEGDKRGRTIGFPTANVAHPDHILIPGHGVYAGMSQFDGQRFGCAVNIGTRPTFSGDQVLVEAHILDFSGDLYGRKVVLEILHRIRGERKFPSVAALKSQIEADCSAVRQLLAADSP